MQSELPVQRKVAVPHNPDETQYREKRAIPINPSMRNERWFWFIKHNPVQPQGLANP